MKYSDRSVDIFGIPVFGGMESEVLERVTSATGLPIAGGPLTVLTPTTEQVVMAQQDDALCDSFRSADINVPDATGLILADRLLAWRYHRPRHLKTRIVGVDLAENLCAKAVEKGLKVFLLGGRGQTAKAAEEALSHRYAGLQVMGEEGFADIVSEITNSKLQTNKTMRVIQHIQDFKTDILLVAFGAPWQERWVTENHMALGAAGVKVAMVIGGTLDYWAGNTARAPIKWRQGGLEWLWRLVHEPWRWRRQLRLVQFMGMVGKGLIWGR